MIEFDNVVFMETNDKVIKKREIKDKIYISHKGENFYAQLKYKKKDLFPELDVELSIKNEELFKEVSSIVTQFELEIKEIMNDYIENTSALFNEIYNDIDNLTDQECFDIIDKRYYSFNSLLDKKSLNFLPRSWINSFFLHDQLFFNVKKKNIFRELKERIKAINNCKAEDFHFLRSNKENNLEKSIFKYKLYNHDLGLYKNILFKISVKNGDIIVDNDYRDPLLPDIFNYGFNIDSIKDEYYNALFSKLNIIEEMKKDFIFKIPDMINFELSFKDLAFREIKDEALLIFDTLTDSVDVLIGEEKQNTSFENLNIEPKDIFNMF
jgi:plasmid maintenance system killer protein